jgi:hypothetical protein
MAHAMFLSSLVPVTNVLRSVVVPEAATFHRSAVNSVHGHVAACSTQKHNQKATGLQISFAFAGKDLLYGFATICNPIEFEEIQMSIHVYGRGKLPFFSIFLYFH